MSMDATQRRNAVRDRYARAATTGDGCCGPVDSCDPSNGATTAATAVAEEISCAVGYDESELKSVPDGANLGLGCGNPVALASLSPGETVLDLGSGAGFDCFLAAERVEPDGLVIGVDMTPEMLERARGNAQSGGFANVEFRLGEIEALPVADATVDAVISNCVLNLSGDRPRVLAEVMRVLKPGGRVMISDLVSDHPVPDFVAASKDSLVGCLPCSFRSIGRIWPAPDSPRSAWSHASAIPPSTSWPTRGCRLSFDAIRCAKRRSATSWSPSTAGPSGR